MGQPRKGNRRYTLSLPERLETDVEKLAPKLPPYLDKSIGALLTLAFTDFLARFEADPDKTLQTAIRHASLRRK